MLWRKMKHGRGSDMLQKDRGRFEVTWGRGAENVESLFHGYSELSLHLCFLICKLMSVVPGIPSRSRVL